MEVQCWTQERLGGEEEEEHRENEPMQPTATVTTVSSTKFIDQVEQKNSNNWTENSNRTRKSVSDLVNQEQHLKIDKSRKDSCKLCQDDDIWSGLGSLLQMMDYAKKSLSLLAPASISKCVSASTSMTQQLLSGRAYRPKPFRVTNADRSVKKGIMADGLGELINKVSDSLNVPCVGALVLDEDGTGVDTEDFFQTLPDNAALMVLEKGQRWTPSPNSPSARQLGDSRFHRRTDVAKLTFDLYKNNPKDFIGCLNVRATLYGVYSVSYDLRCYAAKRMLKEALRWAILSMQATGHILLGSSWYIEQLLEEEEQLQAARSLALPQESMIRQLQSVLLGKPTL